jgi:sugar phosphate isomerase/epimerase
MNPTRRRFLRSSAAAASTALTAGVPLRSLAALAADDRFRSDIGIQLYTLRNQLANDTPGTVKSVAEAGYRQVEMFGFPDCDPVVAAARENGLGLHSSHFQWDTVVAPKDEAMSDFMRIVEKAKGIGLSHLVIPYLHAETRKSLADYQKLAASFNKAAAKAKVAGIQLAYHNHAFEFQPMDGGKTGYDVFTDEFAPEMMFEVDVFWVKVGGVDPADLIAKLKGRVSQLHLKDLKDGLDLPEFGAVPDDAFQELGDGVIPMEPLIQAAHGAGVAHCHVEQDQSPDPLSSIRQSMEYLKAL